ncbi:MAG: GNAT family N-acetyltransferase [Armatimonadota bacterium]
MFTCRVNSEVELRLLDHRHVEELFALTDHNRKHLEPWMLWIHGSTTIEHTRAFIRGALQQFAENCGFHTGIWYCGQLTGVVGMLPINWSNHSVELGYWLGAEFEGKGLVTMTCRALIEHAFRELGLNRVEIRLASENRRSKAVVERLGFTHEGTLRQAELLNGTLVDIERFALLRGDWERRTP